MRTQAVIFVQEGAVNADFIIAQLAEYETILLDEARKFAFTGRKDLVNKYLALVKYTPKPKDGSLESTLENDTVRDADGNIDLKALVREMKRQFTERD